MAKRVNTPKRLLAEVEAIKGRLSKLREEFRDLLSHAEAIMESMENADECIEDGIRMFRDAEAEMSKYV